MKLALIPPDCKLDLIKHTDYQLCLAQRLPEAGSDSRYMGEYSYKYHSLRHTSNDYIIMDNGANEGEQVVGEDLISKAIWWGANEIVAPDVMGDADATMEKTTAFYNTYIRYKERGVKPDKGWSKLAFVPQGQNVKEIYQSIEWAFKVGWIDTVMLARNINNLPVWGIDSKELRLEVAVRTKEQYVGTDIEIHFLGGDPSFPEEIREAAEYGFIRGMDTSLPFNYAYAGYYVDDKEVMDNFPERIDRPSNYFDLKSEDFKHSIAEYNVFTMMRWAKIREVRQLRCGRACD